MNPYILFATALILLLTLLKWKLKYWQRIGLPTLTPILFFGDSKPLICGQLSIGEQFQQFYKKFKAAGHRHGGVYFGTTPFYVPVDIKMIKNILQTDFPHFTNHGVFIDEKVDPLSGHLFSLEDDKWRNMRFKLTPTFTSAKMKMMFQTLTECAIGLKELLEDISTKDAPADITDITGRFGTDVIGSVAFGLDCNSLKDPDSPFRKYGTQVFDDSAWNRMKSFLQIVLPRKVLKVIKFRMTKKDVERFYMKTVRDTVEYREKNKVYRQDFMHLLIQLKNRGRVVDDKEITDQSGKITKNGLTINEVAAQAFFFFIAGFESSSITVAFALYELATNVNMQETLRNEIRSVLAKYDNELTYNAVMEMEYLEKVFYETLRKYPPVNMLIRQCSKDYTIPDSNIVIEKGIRVGIPVLGVHKDAEFYPDPEIFDPERFSEENNKKRPPYTWLPFGDGPRICIGKRFGLLQTKVNLITVIKDYQVIFNPKTKIPIVFNKYKVLTAAQGGIWLNIKKLH